MRARSSTSGNFIKYINKIKAAEKSSPEKGSGADETVPVMADPFLQKIFIRSERLQYVQVLSDLFTVRA